MARGEAEERNPLGCYQGLSIIWIEEHVDTTVAMHRGGCLNFLIEFYVSEQTE